MTSIQKIGFVLGPLLFVIFQWGVSLEGLSQSGHSVLGVTLWVSIWWITEVISLAATSLLPILLFPITGALDITETTKAYGHPYVFLFLGGFILAIAIEKWNLHKRLALNIILRIGTNPGRMLLGFMGATAFLSMWISNTAATVMLLPIGMAVIKLQSDEKVNGFSRALMLGIAYAASIGGMATLIGTPPNLVLAGIIKSSYAIELTFTQWFVFAFPLCVVLFLMAWLYLRRSIQLKNQNNKTPLAEGDEVVRQELLSLGQMSRQERAVGWVFLGMVFLWTTRSAIFTRFIPELSDTSIALIGALVLFLLPAGPNDKLLTWNDTRELPWGILILFGGGMAIAIGFEASGLAKWIGMQLVSLEHLPFWLLLVVLVASVNFLTEITSNMATTAILLPVLVSLTAILDIHPYTLILPATLAASCAFMLPVATPPNALVFSSGKVSIGEMVRFGFWFNLTAIALISLYAFWLVPIFFDAG